MNLLRSLFLLAFLSPAPGACAERADLQFPPEVVEFLAQQTEPYCGPNPFAKDQDFFAIAIDREAFHRLATQAPDAAMFLAAIRDANEVQPIRVRTGDGFAPSIPTARTALDAWDRPTEESSEPDWLLGENERSSTPPASKHSPTGTCC